tara:strand:+ start:404 stop:2242 length:1839 start_codon:yes stop_codon:yes gene_type:complete
MAATNQFDQGTQGTSGTGQFIAVKVKDVIYDLSHPRAEGLGGWDALGTIMYIKLSELVNNPELEHPEKGMKSKDMDVAKPFYANQKYYPLINEIVLIFSSTGKSIIKSTRDTYYISNVNIWNHPHHNALPQIKKYKDEQETKGDYIKATGGLVRQVTDGQTDIKLGEYFSEQLNTKPLLPYEGDYIIEGRFGNSIRFGSTVISNNIPDENKPNWSSTGNLGDPITIIRNGQSDELDDKGWVPTIENINRDASSIYLTSNQLIDNLIISSTNFKSWGAKLEVPKDPIEELVNPTVEPVKEEESSVTSDQIDDALQPDDEEGNEPDKSAQAQEEVNQIDDTTTTPPKVEEEDDELSIYDELLESGDYDEEDFDSEIEPNTDFNEITATTVIVLNNNYSSTENIPAYSGDHVPTASSFRSNGQLDVNMMIGNNFKLKHFIKSSTADKNGYNNMPGVDEGYKSEWSEEYIMRNLINLAENCVDLIYVKFPNMNITSGYRAKQLNDAVGSTDSSHHPKGCAVDFQVPNTRASVVFNWCIGNLPTWAQILWEFPEKESKPGRGAWVHLAYQAGRNKKKNTLASSRKSIHQAYKDSNPDYSWSGRTYGHYIKSANQSFV